MPISHTKCKKCLENTRKFDAFALGSHPFANIECLAQSDVCAVVLILRRARNADSIFLSLLKQFHARLHWRRAVLLLGGIRPDLLAALGTTGLNTVFRRQRIFPVGATDLPFDVDVIAFAFAQVGEHSQSC